MPAVAAGGGYSQVIGFNFPVIGPQPNTVDTEVITVGSTIVWSQRHVAAGLTAPATYPNAQNLPQAISDSFSMLTPNKEFIGLVSFGVKCRLKGTPNTNIDNTEIIIRFMRLRVGALETDFNNWEQMRQCEIRHHIEKGSKGSSTGIEAQDYDFCEYKSVLAELDPRYYYTVMIQCDSMQHNGIELKQDQDDATTLTIVEVATGLSSISGGGPSSTGVIPIEPDSLPTAMEFGIDNSNTNAAYATAFNSADCVVMPANTTFPSTTVTFVTNEDPNRVCTTQFQQFHADSTGYSIWISVFLVA